MDKNASRCKECERKHQNTVEITKLANRPTKVFGEVERRAIKSSLNDDGVRVEKRKKK